MKKLLLLAFVIGALCSILPANALVIYDNGDPDFVSGFYSDFDGEQQEADNFVLQPGATELSGIHWYGMHDLSQSPQVDAFTIRIFTSTGGLPSANAFYQISGIDGGAAFVGSGVGGFDVYEYSVEIAPIALSANTTYWLSIVNNTSGPADDDWAWATHAQVGSAAFRHGDQLAWVGDSIEFAFYLTTVPEPASLTLLGLGLAGLAYRRRRTA